MKFKNRLGYSETIHMRGLSPKNEPIRARRLDCRGGMPSILSDSHLVFRSILYRSEGQNSGKHLPTCLEVFSSASSSPFRLSAGSGPGPMKPSSLSCTLSSKRTAFPPFDVPLIPNGSPSPAFRFDIFFQSFFFAGSPVSPSPARRG